MLLQKLLLLCLVLIIFIFNKCTANVNSFTVNKLSNSAQSSLQTVFACYNVNSSYTGPTFQFRRDSDNNQTNFYADINGNLGTGKNASGTSLSSWLSAIGESVATAYISIWFDQSGHGRNAYQITEANQPKFDTSRYLVDFKSTRSVFFVMDPTSFSLGNIPYTITVKLETMGTCSYSNCAIFKVGVDNYKETLGLVYNTHYLDWWSYDDHFFGNSITSGNIISMVYDQSQRSNFINGALAVTVADNSHNTQPTAAFLGFSDHPAGVHGSMNGELYYFYSFSSNLTSTDRSLVEGFPPPTYQPTLMPSNPTTSPSSTRPTEQITKASSIKPNALPKINSKGKKSNNNNNKHNHRTKGKRSQIKKEIDIDLSLRLSTQK